MNSFWRIVFFIFPGPKVPKIMWIDVVPYMTLQWLSFKDLEKTSRFSTIFMFAHYFSQVLPKFRFPRNHLNFTQKDFMPFNFLFFSIAVTTYNLYIHHVAEKKKWPKFSNTRAEDSTFSRWLVMTFENWSNHEHLLRRGGGVVSPSLQQGDFPSFSA